MLYLIKIWGQGRYGGSCIISIKLKDMANDFQVWLIDQWYYRYQRKGLGEWMKDGEVVSGKELHQKLKEWKTLEK